MADTVILSPLHHRHMALVGKKRGSYEEENAVVEDVPVFHNSKRTRDESVFSQKENESLPLQSVSLYNPNVNISLSVHQQNIEFLTKTYESQIAQMKLQHQNQIESKNKELAQIMVINQRLTEECRKVHEENKSLLEENKVFKRAIPIQESKNKELIQQSLQYETVIQQAVEHIHQLEERNRALSNELALQRRGQSLSFFPPHNPPDVF